MRLDNPHETVGDKQWVFWNQWPEKKPVTFELIDYFNAPVVDKHGPYFLYYAISKSNFDQTRVGDKVLLFITFRAYHTALNMVGAMYRIPMKQYQHQRINCLMTLEKVSKERIRIHKQEPLEPTEEHLKEADKEYSYWGQFRSDDIEDHRPLRKYKNGRKS